MVILYFVILYLKFTFSINYLAEIDIHAAVFDAIDTFDVVLITYDALLRNMSFLLQLRKFRWHRIVLDECQELKCSTSSIARQCSNLTASNRWMVSGTPFINSIDDLNGELQFLKVWPFSLSDSLDGFWQKKIGGPFAEKEESSLELLYALIDVVMMRHSKSQRYLLNNSKLVQIPQRIIEWRAFDITNPHELYIVKYLESFTVHAFLAFMKSNAEFIGVDQATTVHPNYPQIRSLYQLLSKCITDSGNFSKQQVDHLRRLLCPNRQMLRAWNQNNTNTNVDAIPVMYAEEALAIMQMGGMGVGGGFNKDTNRAVVSTAYGLKHMELSEKLLDLSFQELRYLKLFFPL